MTGAASGALVVWNAGKGTEVARWKSDASTPIVALDVADKGHTLAVASGARVLVFDLEAP